MQQGLGLGLGFEEEGDSFAGEAGEWGREAALGEDGGGEVEGAEQRQWKVEEAEDVAEAEIEIDAKKAEQRAAAMGREAEEASQRRAASPQLHHIHRASSSLPLSSSISISRSRSSLAMALAMAMAPPALAMMLVLLQALLRWRR
jgi:hypothetical protein